MSASRRRVPALATFLAAGALTVAGASCGGGSGGGGGGGGGSGGAAAAASSSKAAPPPARYGLGRAATAQEVALLDTDVDTTGAGLPPGSGTPQRGAAVYAQKCASCHGARGEGIGPNPRLVQPLAAADSFPFARDHKVPKTPGNYWPFATTLYGYIAHTMPPTAPRSLTPDEVYGVVAFLLAENGVVPATAVMDARTLPAVRMPARGRFVLDDRRGGAEVR